MQGTPIVRFHTDMLTNINPTRAKKAQYIRILFPPSLFLKYSGIVKAYKKQNRMLVGIYYNCW